MDAFEQLVSEILWLEGKWVRTAVKVNLTQAEKVKIGRPSSPRWELDIVAYGGRDNILQVVECKSFMDSSGVMASGFDGTPRKKDVYKLFNDETLRSVVLNRLRLQFAESGACHATPEVRLSLACGKIRDRDRA